MNRDDVVRIAREVWGQTAVLPFADLERFAALVEQHKLEEVISILERLHERSGETHNYYLYATNVLRGESGNAGSLTKGATWEWQK